MTLDETIKHCLEVAEQNETQAQKIGRQLVGSAIDKYATDCRECANDHRQLAEWLTELRELRRLVDLVAKYAGNSEDVCERYLPSINGDLCVTDGMGASNCTCCGYEYRCDYKTDIGLLEDVETSTNADVQPVQWISCKDNMPDTLERGLSVMYSDCCLVCDAFGWVGMAYYITDGQKSWWEFADAQNKNKIDWTGVTHWMPLPEPPKED